MRLAGTKWLASICPVWDTQDTGDLCLFIVPLNEVACIVAYTPYRIWCSASASSLWVPEFGQVGSESVVDGTMEFISS